MVTKAAVAKPRKMLGKIGGGAVRLAPLADGAALGICEGIETGLAVMKACPGLTVWATLSTSGLEQVQLPPEAKRVIVLADHDESAPVSAPPKPLHGGSAWRVERRSSPCRLRKDRTSMTCFWHQGQRP